MITDETVFSAMDHDDLCPAKHRDEPCRCIVAYAEKLRADIDLLRKGQPITRADVREEGRLKKDLSDALLQISEMKRGIEEATAALQNQSRQECYRQLMAILGTIEKRVAPSPICKGCGDPTSHCTCWAKDARGCQKCVPNRGTAEWCDSSNRCR